MFKSRNTLNSQRLDFGLLRVGRDDLEIMKMPEREERIARSSAGMNSAELGLNTSAALNQRNARIQIAATEKNVVE